MDVKDLIKLLKVIKILVWIYFLIAFSICLCSCIISLEENLWSIRGLIWEGCVIDVFRMVSSLLIFIYLKPLKVKDPIE
jgi:hypothetical protein